MRIIIAAIGKLKDSGERDLFDRYAKRIDQSGRSQSLGPLTVIELPESRALEVASRKSDESTRLLKAVSAAQAIVALDEFGHNLTSTAFATRLAQFRDEGVGTIALLLGGPDGHGADVIAAAKLKLSLGAMTLPHGLARVIVAEQLYRATTILSGHPYHRA
ncbi:MAG: 23S rRNA (pseudouridine(1915)-N(3))-methyltransferase RlmH [Hyphomicrobiaceae bacterium]